MIIFFEYGRLGNQLFQYAAIRENFPKERLIFFGFSDLKQALTLVDATIIDWEKFPRWIKYVLSKVFPALVRFRVIGGIYEDHSELSYGIRMRRGLVSPLYLLGPSYFQHQDIVKKLNPKYEISQGFIDEAIEWLRSKKITAGAKNLVFIHIRRGDYLWWPSGSSPAVLEISWYLRAIEILKAEVNNPLFLILTDDIDHAEHSFGRIQDVFISHNNQFVDLAIMSLCSHGILSASSFSWWGAWFSRNAHKSLQTAIYIGPINWIGHRNKKWIPPNMVSDWIKYI